MTTLTWLHLSNFHFNGGRKPDDKKLELHWQPDVVLQTLRRDVIKELKLYSDKVFVTGDIAQAGKADDYPLANGGSRQE